jgi:glucan phosphoethanolaminetransferase (alkaline phosphatase superfamily)
LQLALIKVFFGKPTDVPTLSNKYRLPLAILNLISFFIPAYDNTSGFQFIGLAFAEAEARAEITLIDVLIIITPLIFIPVITLVVCIRSAMKARIRTTIIGLPLVLLVFFFVLLVFTGIASNDHITASKLFFSMEIGFYVAAIASLLLIFTKNGSRHKRRRKGHSSEMETTVIVED